MDDLIAKARREFEATQGSLRGEIAPSDAWQHNLVSLSPTIGGVETAAQLCEMITRMTHFTFPRMTDDALFPKILARYTQWLDERGAWKRFPEYVQESPFANQGVKVEFDGRVVSAGFLLHLCVMTRLLENAVAPASVVEIGGGYGALARLMKLVLPEVSYVIVDLPHSLFFSSVFLRTNFPQARTLYVDTPESLPDCRSYDFVFVPAQFLSALDKACFDLAVNVNSLGEMTQDAVDRYMDLINSDRVAALYSINRFGTFAKAGSPRKESADICNMSVWLDPHWAIPNWDMHGESGFAQFEPVAPAYLELLAKRIPVSIRSADLYAQMADRMMTAAKHRQRRDGRWHYLMWNACRYDPSPEHKSYYASALGELGFAEAAWYKR